MEPVRRNLNFLAYNLEPNGELVTQYSRRQDRGGVQLLQGYPLLSEMAVRDQNGLWASMADLAFDLQVKAGNSPAGYIPQQDFLRLEQVERTPLPSSYERFFPQSCLLRIREGDLSATLMADNDGNLLSFRSGDAVIEGMQIRYRYYSSSRTFSPDRIRYRDGQYILTYWFMSYASRAPWGRVIPHPADFKVRVTVERPEPKTLALEIAAESPRNVILQIEFFLRLEGRLVIGGETHDLKEMGLVYLEDEAVLETLPGKSGRLRISGGTIQHRAMPTDPRGPMLAITPLTPYRGRMSFGGNEGIPEVGAHDIWTPGSNAPLHRVHQATGPVVPTITLGR